MLDFAKQGIPTFDYGNNIRQVAKDEGVENAFDFPGFVPAYIRPLFCRGVGPFRWAALSGDPQDIYKTDAAIESGCSPRTSTCTAGSTWRASAIAFQGLPARICWIGLGDRDRAGIMFNDMVASGELKAPIVIGRDHLDSGSVASPNRETEAMRDGSDAGIGLADAERAAQHGVGRDLGCRCITAVASAWAIRSTPASSSSPTARRARARSWRACCGMIPRPGVMRHADAGYEIALDAAREHHLDLPGILP